MTVEIEHISGLERIKLRMWRGEGDARVKRGVIIEFHPDDLPVVPELGEYPTLDISTLLQRET